LIVGAFIVAVVVGAILAEDRLDALVVLASAAVLAIHLSGY
jgi:hypothetical protein